MSRDPARAATQFFGGRVCLDFANTLDWRTSDEPQELIPNYAALLSWSGPRGPAPAEPTAKLQVRSAGDDAGAQEVMTEAYSLRAEIWKAAESLRAGQA